MNQPVPFPDDLREFVASTGWTFAKTYAATWPHEDVVRTAENAPTILALFRFVGIMLHEPAPMLLSSRLELA